MPSRGLRRLRRRPRTCRRWGHSNRATEKAHPIGVLCLHALEEDPATVAIFDGLRSLLGTVVTDRYRLDRLIAVGGMGAIFRARHLGLDRDVALKILRPDLGDAQEITARFEREAKLSSRLDHPNCVRVMDVGITDDGTRFLAMELVEGTDLSHLLGQPIQLERALHIASQILRGLDHAHRRGVTHRDVKPANVLLVEGAEGDELVKVCDFGIAKVRRGSGDGFTTRVGMVFGTPGYMSPEQALGVDVDDRTDLYSAGIILYEMLAGSPPFDDADPVALIQMHVSRPPPPLPLSVPPVVAAVVGRLLAKARDGRFDTAGDALDALEGAIEMVASANPAVVPRERLPTPRQEETNTAHAMLGDSLQASERTDEPKASKSAILRAFDKSLEQILEKATPIASDSLLPSIHGRPEPDPGEYIDMNNLELEDLEPSRYGK